MKLLYDFMFHYVLGSRNVQIMLLITVMLYVILAVWNWMISLVCVCMRACVRVCVCPIARVALVSVSSAV